MRLFLMRHATAADPGGVPDALRPLTEQGRLDAREAGKAIHDMNEELALVLTSPRLRARETAELLVEGYGRQVPVVIRETLTCGASASAYLAQIDAHPVGRILLVAHNPEMSAFASQLTGASMSFRPGSLCALRVGPEGAVLDWRWDPTHNHG
jgi:phosphohistidine phosphatase